ncbi:MAG: AarF/ABC1/UbiB kinase family protein [Patescibacteria group bacterium]|nr:AarF/ABC1/UbiB kinase family protein [Patescibacteria group bacterium]
MNPLSLKDAVGDIRRFRYIVTVLFEEGLSFLVADLRLHVFVPTTSRWRCWWRRGSPSCRRVALGRAAEPPPEVRLRHAFERLGPSFIKLGQIMSTRPDIIPAEYVRELAKLQDRVPPLAPGVAEHAVAAALGRPIRDVFKSFNRRPVAAASLAQVHRATLPDGTRVAVKVRRPGVEKIVRTDVHILLLLARFIEDGVPRARRYRPLELAHQFAELILRELDFTDEAANIERFAANFADEPTVVVPRVHWELTTDSVLTMDYVDGVKVDDFAGLAKAGIDRHDLARTGLRLGFHQFFLDGFFHADPHPGNLVAMPPTSEGEGPRVGLYDFGQVGNLPEKLRYELVSCFIALAEKDVERYIAHMLDLAGRRDDADVEGFSSDARTLLTGVIHKPATKKRLGQVFYEVMLSGARRGLIFPRELLVTGKALLTFENTGLALDPEINIVEVMQPFLSEVFRQEFSPKKLAKDAAATAFDRLYLLKHLPEETRLLMERLARGEIGVRIDLDELRGLKAEFDRENDVRVLAVLASAGLIGSALTLWSNASSVPFWAMLGRLGFGLSLALAVWVFVMVGQKPK